MEGIKGGLKFDPNQKFLRRIPMRDVPLLRSAKDYSIGSN